MNCDKCESDFDRDQLSVVSFGGSDPSFPKSQILCGKCEMIHRMETYREKYEQSRDSIERLKGELNLFRSVLLRPETMATLADDPMTPQPSVSEIKRRVANLKDLSVDQLLFWMETYEIYTREISAVINAQASKDDLKAHLEKKTRTAILQTKAAMDAPVARRVAMTAEDKAIKQMMKALHCDEKTAREYVNSMKA